MDLQFFHPSMLAGCTCGCGYQPHHRQPRQVGEQAVDGGLWATRPRPPCLAERQADQAEGVQVDGGLGLGLVHAAGSGTDGD